MTLPASDVFSPGAFRGRVYGVTGSGRGIGEATIKHLVKLGASVVVIDLNPDRVRRVEANLKAMKAPALCLQGDVTDRKVLKKAIQTAYRRWGRIDGWVSNPPYNPAGLSVETLPPRELRRAWEVNTEAAWVACGLLVPLMKKSGGSIVNLSSIQAYKPVAGCAAYAMAKAGVEGLTRGLAIDLAPYRIRVNAVVPGVIPGGFDTSEIRPPPNVPAAVVKRKLALEKRGMDMIWRSEQPWPEEGHTSHVANAILFLLSDAARFITGASLWVDGGANVFSSGHAHRAWLGAFDLTGMKRDGKEHRAILKKYPEFGG